MDDDFEKLIRREHLKGLINENIAAGEHLFRNFNKLVKRDGGRNIKGYLEYYAEIKQNYEENISELRKYEDLNLDITKDLKCIGRQN